MNKAAILFLFSILFFESCDRQTSDEEKIREFLQSKDLILSDYKRIMLISETGCPKCAISFANLCSNFIEKENTLFIINATGKFVDISKLSQSKSVLFDFENEFRKLRIVGCETPCGIIMNEGQIDTVISIQANGISDRLRYLSSSF